MGLVESDSENKNGTIDIITGRIIKPPQLKQFDSGKKNCKFTIAYKEQIKDDESKQYDHLMNCTAWGSLADTLVKNFPKGAVVVCTGKKEIDQYFTEKNNKECYKFTVNNAFVDVMKTTIAVLPPTSATPKVSVADNVSDDDLQE